MSLNEAFAAVPPSHNRASLAPPLISSFPISPQPMEIFANKIVPPILQPEFLVTTLRDHQKAGIAWMIHRETHPFRGCRGGLLLDDVGLGKTLQVLVTIYAQKQNGITGTTLVISDRQIMDVWQNERDTHFAPEHALTSYTYHGKKARDEFKALEDPATFLAQFDIVFTTYDTMRIERNKNYNETVIVAIEGDTLNRHSPFFPGSLFLQSFRRVILDEAHKIRNRSAGYYQSVIHLRDQQTIHWGLSAKPVLNRLDDLFPLMQFLNVEPFSDSRFGYSRWRTQIVRPVEYNSRSGMRTLHEYMVPVTLRRTKVILGLPELHKIEEEIPFQDIEFEFYSRLYCYVRERVEKLILRMDAIRNSGGSVDPGDHRINMACASVNAMVTRLRQCCCAPALVLKTMRRFQPLLAEPDVLKACINRMKHLLDNPEEVEECGVCMDTEADVMAIPCKHLCCGQCWRSVEQTSNTAPRCPFCRTVLTAYRKVSSETTAALNAEIEPENLDYLGKVSSKVDFLIGRLKEQIWDEKIVVVTDFRTFLDVIETAIQDDPMLKDVPRVRIDGKVTGANRFGLVRQFQSDDAESPRLLLMTYKCGGEGITLTAATRLYEMNPWWNEAQMYQAEGRLHRLGQQRPVFVHQLRLVGSIDDKIYEMVDRKGFLSDATLSRSETAPEKMLWANRVRLMMNLDDLAPERVSKRRRLGADGEWKIEGSSEPVEDSIW